MDTLVPSLQNLSCVKMITLLFVEIRPFIVAQYHFPSPVTTSFIDQKLDAIKNEIKEKISRVMPIVSLQEKLEKFIEPLFYEVEQFFSSLLIHWKGDEKILFAICDTIPQCWLSDGTINQEKFYKSLVKEANICPVKRFLYAFLYCPLDCIVDLWKLLSDEEKARIRQDTRFGVRWIDWLDGKSDVDPRFDGSLWHRNLCALKRSLPALSSEAKHLSLIRSVVRERVRPDIMRFCLSLITTDEQKKVFRANVSEVFRCLISWPLRSDYFAFEHNLVPYLTKSSFRDVLTLLLIEIIKQKRNCGELIVILKKLWRTSPDPFKNFVTGNHYHFLQPLQYVLKHDFTQEFPRDEFVRSFKRHHLITETMKLLEIN